MVDDLTGQCFIEHGGKRAAVKVARTAYFIRDAVVEKDQAGNLVEVTLEVDDGSHELLEATSLQLDDAGILRVKIKEGRFWACCLPAAHFRIAELLEADDAGNFFIVIDKNRFNLA
jgi:hypothetical protein